jgi:hypothetical protein
MGGYPSHHVGSLAVLAAGERRLERVCFADEVAVDFPSMAHAVDRIRRGFVADERAAALRTAVRLSPDEARVGAVRPLDVPVMSTCRACGGRGETWAETCRRCDGSGTELEHHRLRVSVPAGVRHGTCFHLTVAPRFNLPTRVELRVVVT